MIMRSTIYMVALLIAIPVFAQDGADEVADNKQVLFISDLHMGVGRDPTDETKWHPTEDFRWHTAFDDFLRGMVATGSGSIELVILGDFLELWQTLQDDCKHQRTNFNLGCSETEAMRRTKRVLSQHPEVFSDLSWFAGQGDNRVTILAGNHDVALAFEGVRNKVKEAFSETVRDRVTIETSGVWTSSDGRIVAEHGQQIGSDPNKFDGWPDDPFLVENDITYLVQPWGEHLVQEIFNELEAKYPIIDNLSEELHGIRYASKGSSWRDKLVAVGRALRFIFTQTSWDQTMQFLGKDGIPEWDIKAMQKKLGTDEARWKFLVQSLPATAELRIALVSTGESSEVPAFSEEEIEAICDRRWALEKAQPKRGIELCKGTGKMSMIAERVADVVNPRARDERFKSYFLELRQQRKVNNKFNRYIYGHTHKVEIAYKPYGDDPKGVQVYNDGAWQRTVTPEQLCTIAKAKGWSDDVVLDRARPEDLPACYPFITAVWKSGQIYISNLYWNQQKGEIGAWDESCTAAPRIHPDCR